MNLHANAPTRAGGVTTAGGEILVERMRKVYAAGGQTVTALEDIDLRVLPGEFVCLLGPSGCGKSTLLNTLAGFEKLTSGTVSFQGKTVLRPGPDRCMVFQEYALFPWMTVAKNVAFGLELKRVGKHEVERTVECLLTQFGLRNFGKRFPKDLSGGMRQRVAIARAMALDPPVLLMDEPFGALDALTRRTLQDELVRVWTESGKTIVFVTHSMEEAIYLADRIVVMSYRPGTIVLDVPIDIARPRDTAAQDFNELKRRLSGHLMKEQDRFVRAELRATEP